MQKCEVCGLKATYKINRVRELITLEGEFLSKSKTKSKKVCQYCWLKEYEKDV